jgi:hypothetical protein
VNSKGLENLLPCKPLPNLTKGAKLLDPGPAHFFLTLAASKKPEVERNVAAISKRLASGRTFAYMQQLLASGQITQADLPRLLAGPHSETFALATRLPFLDGPDVISIAKTDISDLIQRRIALGGVTHIDGVTLAHDSGTERHVRTCEEYWSAIADGFYALTTFAMNMQTYFQQYCGLLSALSRATLPLYSHLDRVGLPDLHLLPFSLFPDWAEVRGETIVHTGTYRDRVIDGRLLIKDLASRLLRVESPSGLGQLLLEVVRADFNGDGAEELLLYYSVYATQGTFGYGGITILGRESDEAAFQVVG